MLRRVIVELVIETDTESEAYDVVNEILRPQTQDYIDSALADYCIVGSAS